MAVTSIVANRREADEFKYIEVLIGISGRSLFSFFRQKQVVDLLSHHGQFEFFHAGDVIAQPESLGAVLMVGEGQVELIDKATRQRVGVVTSGRSIELGTFLKQGSQWRYEWRAESAGCLFRIDREGIEALLAQDPDVRPYLLRMTSEPAARRLAKDLRLIGFKRPQVVKVLAAMQELTPTGATVALPEAGLVSVRSGEAWLKLLEGRRQSILHMLATDHTWVDPASTELAFDTSSRPELFVISASALRAIARDEEVDLLARLGRASYARMLQPDQQPGTQASSLVAPIDADEPEEDDGLELKDFAPSESRWRRPWRRKPPHVQQHDEMDCGAACLAIVSRHYGRRLSIASLRSVVQVTKDGASLDALRRGAGAIGLLAAGFMASPGNLKDFRTPFIALMRGHFVVVFEITDDEVVISDPAVGLVRLTHDEFERDYSLNVLALKPSERFWENKNSPPSFMKYRLILTGHRADLARIFVLAGLGFALGLAGPLIQQVMFDGIIVSGKVHLVHALILAMAVLTVADNLLKWIQAALITHLTSSLDVKFSALFLRHMYSLPLSYYALRRVGDFTSRLGELARIREFLTFKPLQLCLNVVSIVIYSTVVGLYSMTLLGLTLACLPIMLGFIIYMTPKLSENKRRLYNVMAKQSSAMIEQTRNLATIKSLNAELAARWRWIERNLETFSLSRRGAKLGSVMAGMSAVINQAMNNLVLVAAIYLFMRNELTLGQVVAVSGLTRQIAGPAVALLQEWNNFNQIGVSFGRIDDVITAGAEDLGDASATVSLKGDIEVKNVTFQYGNELSPVVLNHINLRIVAGQTVAFVGRSGSGKSTMAYVLAMLYRPSRGQIFFDGQDAAALPLAALRRNISFVLQENNVFSGSVLENIALGSSEPSLDLAVAAAKAADAHGFICEMPNGYFTRLDEGGEALSGGQRQRLCIARTFYRPTPILVMDEATSSLDSISEEAIVKNLKRRHGQVTTIVIAHRLNTVVNADMIIVFDKGRIVEQGTHKDLIEARGHYFNLFSRQVSEFA